MASDIKAMKEMMQQSMRMKQGDDATPVDDPRIPKVDPRKFRWQMWMYITIAVIGLLLFFLQLECLRYCRSSEEHTGSGIIHAPMGIWGYKVVIHCT